MLCGTKNVLIDTVPERAAKVWDEELEQLIPHKTIDALILNHSEEDHSGGLSLLLSRTPNLPIYCTEACKERLKNQYPNANFICVENGETIWIGDFRFGFIHTPGLHWDDNMVTYYENEKILFSNDLFGQYLACDTLVDHITSVHDLTSSMTGYFEKVFASATLEQKWVVSKIMDLGLLQIAPGHGVVLRYKLQSALDFYRKKCLEQL